MSECIFCHTTGEQTKMAQMAVRVPLEVGSTAKFLDVWACARCCEPHAETFYRAHWCAPTAAEYAAAAEQAT